MGKPLQYYVSQGKENPGKARARESLGKPGEAWANLGKPGQAWASLGKPGQACAGQGNDK